MENEYTDEIFDILWTKKYAPKDLSEVVLSDEVRALVDDYVARQDIPTLLFCGKPGQGKTTLAKLLCEKINATTLFINASFDNGINVIRGRINNFVETMSPTGSLKVVILDEADRLSPESQDALRSMIEENAEHTRFIFTANERARVTDALQSRAVDINVLPPKAGFTKFILNILRKEAINVTKESMDKLRNILDKYYPDLRRTIGIIQKSIVNRNLIINDNIVGDHFIDKIYKAIETMDPIDIRTEWITYEHEFQGDYQFLLKQLHSYVYELPDMEARLKAYVILEIANGLRDSTFVVDQEINFYATILRIMQKLGKM